MAGCPVTSLSISGVRQRRTGLAMNCMRRRNCRIAERNGSADRAERWIRDPARLGRDRSSFSMQADSDIDRQSLTIDSTSGLTQAAFPPPSAGPASRVPVRRSERGLKLTDYVTICRRQPGATSSARAGSPLCRRRARAPTRRPNRRRVSPRRSAVFPLILQLGPEALRPSFGKTFAMHKSAASPRRG